VLSLDGISKRFDTVDALTNASLFVQGGTVHALLGENGAGKTTLMRVAFGIIAADGGTVSIAGFPGMPKAPSDAISAGLGMVHQHFTNVGAMSVAENVALGGRGMFNARAAARRVEEIGALTGLHLDPEALASDLSVGAQQRLEIVKALARNARVLILDEPTGVLAPAEAADLLRWLRGFADAGNSVVLITHKLRDALSVSDDVTVLRRGVVTLAGSMTGMSEDRLAGALLGDEQRPSQAQRHATRGAQVASVTNVTVSDDRGRQAVRAASFDVWGGEVLGVVGVEGSGQRELLRILAQRATATEGVVQLPATIGFIPEDRHHDGLSLDFDAAENVALRGAGARHGWMNWTAVRARTARIAAGFDVRGDLKSSVHSLSGGNQQKLVLARELDPSPELLIAENPTRGLDIRAAHDVHERLKLAARNGAAVVMYSSDLDEVLSIADRVLVVHDGEVRECETNRDRVGAAMLGVQ
jgi:ABC-type uncharacterized transport system ATPase subunit